jgi:hypothetical protein
MYAKLTIQGSGSVSGHLAQDVVRLGNTAVKSQYFGAVNEESEDFTDSPHSGVMGELALLLPQVFNADQQAWLSPA